MPCERVNEWTNERFVLRMISCYCSAVYYQSTVTEHGCHCNCQSSFSGFVEYNKWWQCCFCRIGKGFYGYVFSGKTKRLDQHFGSCFLVRSHFLLCVYVQTTSIALLLLIGHQKRQLAYKNSLSATTNDSALRDPLILWKYFFYLTSFLFLSFSRLGCGPQKRNLGDNYVLCCQMKSVTALKGTTNAGPC